jgi:GNAT superfamily N-acetyltransferase
MTDTARIKPATTSDIPALRQMLQALSDHDGGTYAVGSEHSLQDALAKGLIHALIHPQGMVIYYPDFSTHRGQPGLYIQDLYVTPPARGTGLARGIGRDTGPDRALVDIIALMARRRAVLLGHNT